MTEQQKQAVLELMNDVASAAFRDFSDTARGALWGAEQTLAAMGLKAAWNPLSGRFDDIVNI